MLDWSTITIEQAQAQHKYQYYNRIREKARREYKKKYDDLKCQVCGYTRHVEVCHKHPISSFPKDTLVSVVNDETNILFLCPNHHWEYDNFYLRERQGKLVPSNPEEFRTTFTKKCAACNDDFIGHAPQAKYCSRRCSGKSNRKAIDRPTKTRLASMLKSMAWKAIGRRYDVTDNSVRKWARSYGLIE